MANRKAAEQGANDAAFKAFMGKATGATDRTWMNTPREEWHTLSDAQLLHFLYLGHSMADRKAGLEPLQESWDTYLLRVLRSRADAREAAANPWSGPR